MRAEVRLVANDWAAGRFVLKSPDGWYLLSVEAAWIPEELTGENEAMAILAHGGMRVGDAKFGSLALARKSLRQEWALLLPTAESFPLSVFAECPRGPLVRVTCQRVESVVRFWSRSLDSDQPPTEEALEQHDAANEQASKVLQIFASRGGSSDNDAIAAVDQFLSLARHASRDGLTRRSKVAGSQIREFAGLLDGEGWEDLRASLMRLARRLYDEGQSTPNTNENSSSGFVKFEKIEKVERESERERKFTAD